MHFPYKKFILYGVGGALGALTDLFFLYVFTEYAGLHYLISQVFSFIISFFVGFLFQKHITFQKK
jgi:putative flippase GtrA